ADTERWLSGLKHRTRNFLAIILAHPAPSNFCLFRPHFFISKPISSGFVAPRATELGSKMVANRSLAVPAKVGSYPAKRGILMTPSGHPKKGASEPRTASFGPAN